MRRRATTAMTLAAAVLLAACDPSPDTTRILSRAPSPDGRVEAIHAEDMGGGATVGPSHDVYVVSPGRFPRLTDRVFIHDYTCRISLRWTGARSLQIDYFARAPLPPGAAGRRPAAWWTPWLWGRSPSSKVEVRARWLGRDPGAGC